VMSDPPPPEMKSSPRPPIKVFDAAPVAVKTSSLSEPVRFSKFTKVSLTGPYSAVPVPSALTLAVTPNPIPWNELVSLPAPPSRKSVPPPPAIRSSPSPPSTVYDAAPANTMVSPSSDPMMFSMLSSVSVSVTGSATENGRAGPVGLPASTMKS